MADSAAVSGMSCATREGEFGFMGAGVPSFSLGLYGTTQVMRLTLLVFSRSIVATRTCLDAARQRNREVQPVQS